MFEEIIEAKSLDDGLAQLAARNFDALFLGPSIQIERTNPFFERAAKVSRAQDCAYVAIFKDFLSGTDLVKRSQAHATVSDKSSKRVFTEAIVRAVLMACDDSPWPGVKLDEDGSILVSDNGVWRKFESDGETASPELTNASAGMAALLSSGVLTILADACGEKVQEETQEELSRLMAKIMAADTAEESDATEDLGGVAAATRRAVQEWLLDKDYMGPNEASKVLKKKLLQLQTLPSSE